MICMYRLVHIPVCTHCLHRRDAPVFPSFYYLKLLQLLLQLLQLLILLLFIIILLHALQWRESVSFYVSTPYVGSYSRSIGCDPNNDTRSRTNPQPATST